MTTIRRARHSQNPIVAIHRWALGIGLFTTLNFVTLHVDAQSIQSEPSTPANAALSQTPSLPNSLLGQPVRVPAFWVDSATGEGGMNLMTVEIGQNRTEEVSIAIGGSRIGGTRDDWRGAAWIAAFCASEATDHLITDYRYIIDPGTSHVGGPSASMMLAATMVAIIRGDAILPNTGMTGTVNPDGSIGPVGGIPNKLKGAQKAGIKRFGYPKGQRFSLDERDIKRVRAGEVANPQDLIREGAALGVEVVEIGDVSDAYQFITGKTIPPLQQVPSQAMEFGSDLASRIIGAINSRLSDANASLDKLTRSIDRKAEEQLPGWVAEREVQYLASNTTKSKSLSEVAKSKVKELARADAEKHKEEWKETAKSELGPIQAEIRYALKYFTEGSLAMAFNKAISASSEAFSRELHWEFSMGLSSGISAKEYERIYEDQYSRAKNRLSGLRAQLDSAVSRSSLGGRVDGIHTFTNYWQARALLESGVIYNTELIAEREVWSKLQDSANAIIGRMNSNRAANKPVTDGISEQDGELVQKYEKSMSRYRALASHMAKAFSKCLALADACENWASFFQDAGPRVSDDPKFYERLGTAFSAAASAGLSWFQSIVVQSEARNLASNLDKDSSVSEASLREMVDKNLLLVDDDYAPVARAAEFADFSNELREKDHLLPLDQLASGSFAYYGCAALINRYYNYGSADTAGEAVGSIWVDRRRTLSHTLDLARRRVLEDCAKLQLKVGFIPDCIKINYDLANDMRDGTDDSRMSALKAYWKCQFLCDLAMRLSPKP